MTALWCPILCFFYGASPPNYYVLPQHIPSIIQAIVLVMPDLSSLLCLLTGDGDPDGDLEGNNPRDIRVRAKGGGLWRISDAHFAYDPLYFVLFHPHGEPG